VALTDPFGWEWRERAACRGQDPDLWYPERGADVSIAKAICAGCPVRADCLAFALGNGEHHGIWGGLSERQRRRMRRSSLTGGDERAARVAWLQRGGWTDREICAELDLTPAQLTLINRRRLEAAS
jgi:hypothetical protein